MYVCIYVCVYVYMYACMYVYVFIIGNHACKLLDAHIFCSRYKITQDKLHVAYIRTPRSESTIDTNMEKPVWKTSVENR